ncbi:von Willebrand factor [Drosophila mauritiana]|uniref:von Willebrand factor n=1 Tax=Drosophila mauritiana TaxID=7226 RepID=A0A6P8JT90_DROMA|nr:von Willebrand factor [Drosophila mauritiana]
MQCRVFSLALLCLLGYTRAKLHRPNHCTHGDMMVKCIPVCPRICSDFLYRQRCIPKKCERGCACPKGWLRLKHNQGRCITRKQCTRYIIE